MDPKTIGIGVVAVAALVVAVAKPGAETKTLTVVAGGTAQDEAATALVKLQPNVGERNCCREREGSPAGIVLRWFCDGQRLPNAQQEELDKMATADTACIKFTPRQVGEKVALDAELHKGALPNLDPVPEPPAEKAEEVEKP